MNAEITGTIACCVIGCNSALEKGIKIYSFPTDENLKEQWIKAIGCRNLNLSPSHGICSRHLIAVAGSQSYEVLSKMEKPEMNTFESIEMAEPSGTFIRESEKVIRSRIIRDSPQVLGVSLFERVQLFRNNNMFCDTTVKAIDGRFLAHKIILASQCPYFQFTLQHQPFNTPIELPLTAVALGALLDYFYTGEIEINETNVKDLLKAAEILLVEEVEKHCKDFLKEIQADDLSETSEIISEGLSNTKQYISNSKSFKSDCESPLDDEEDDDDVVEGFLESLSASQRQTFVTRDVTIPPEALTVIQNDPVLMQALKEYGKTIENNHIVETKVASIKPKRVIKRTFRNYEYCQTKLHKRMIKKSDDDETSSDDFSNEYANGEYVQCYCSHCPHRSHRIAFMEKHIQLKHRFAVIIKKHTSLMSSDMRKISSKMSCFQSPVNSSLFNAKDNHIENSLQSQHTNNSSESEMEKNTEINYDSNMRLQMRLNTHLQMELVNQNISESIDSPKQDHYYSCSVCGFLDAEIRKIRIHIREVHHESEIISPPKKKKKATTNVEVNSKLQLETSNACYMEDAYTLENSNLSIQS